MVGAISRGLALSDLNGMTLGQVVDFCISYNENSETKEDEDDEIIADQSYFVRF